MSNQEIIEKVYKLQMLIREKNGVLAAALEKSTIPLIEYQGSLATASREEILTIRGIGEVTAELILRAIKGEHIYDIAKSVPKPKKRREKWEIECLKSGASSRI